MSGEQSVNIAPLKKAGHPPSSVGERTRVVIFGGFGMQPHHCGQLAALYRQKQSDEVEVFCHSLHEMTVPRIGDRRAQQLAARFNQDESEGGLIVHLFSGAVFIFGCLLPYLKDSVREAIRGVVFECSPMDCKAEQFGRFLSWRLGREYAPKYALPFVALRPLVGITKRFELRHKHERLLLPTSARVHFIQCENDPIVDSGYVELFQRELIARGHEVSHTTHQRARHCRAITDCPKKYQADLREFLNRLWSGEYDRVGDSPAAKIAMAGT